MTEFNPEAHDAQVLFRGYTNLCVHALERRMIEIGRKLNMHPECYLSGEDARRLRELAGFLLEDVDRSEARRKAV